MLTPIPNLNSQHFTRFMPESQSTNWLGDKNWKCMESSLYQWPFPLLSLAVNTPYLYLYIYGPKWTYPTIKQGFKGPWDTSMDGLIYGNYEPRRRNHSTDLIPMSQNSNKNFATFTRGNQWKSMESPNSPYFFRVNLLQIQLPGARCRFRGKIWWKSPSGTMSCLVAICLALYNDG